MIHRIEVMAGLVVGDLVHGGQALRIESAAKAARTCERRGICLARSTARLDHIVVLVVSGGEYHSTSRGTQSPPISCASPCKECSGACREGDGRNAMGGNVESEVEHSVCMRREDGPKRQRVMFQKVNNNEHAQSCKSD